MTKMPSRILSEISIAGCTRHIFGFLSLMSLITLLISGYIYIEDGLHNRKERSIISAIEESPTSDWYEYVEFEGKQTPYTTKDEYTYGEPIEVRSATNRYSNINIRWEDTIYLTNDQINFYKGDTQYRPPYPGLEFKKAGYSTNTRSYQLPYSPLYKYGKICGSVIGVTPKYSFKKSFSYCTNIFKIKH